MKKQATSHICQKIHHDRFNDHSFASLDDQLQLKILESLPINELFIYQRVCRKWRQLIMSINEFSLSIFYHTSLPLPVDLPMQFYCGPKVCYEFTYKEHIATRSSISTLMNSSFMQRLVLLSLNCLLHKHPVIVLPLHRLSALRYLEVNATKIQFESNDSLPSLRHLHCNAHCDQDMLKLFPRLVCLRCVDLDAVDTQRTTCPSLRKLRLTDQFNVFDPHRWKDSLPNLKQLTLQNIDIDFIPVLAQQWPTFNKFILHLDLSTCYINFIHNYVIELVYRLGRQSIECQIVIEYRKSLKYVTEQSLDALLLTIYDLMGKRGDWLTSCFVNGCPLSNRLIETKFKRWFHVLQVKCNNQNKNEFLRFISNSDTIDHLKFVRKAKFVNSNAEEMCRFLNIFIHIQDLELDNELGNAEFKILGQSLPNIKRFLLQGYGQLLSLDFCTEWKLLESFVMENVQVTDWPVLFQLLISAPFLTKIKFLNCPLKPTFAVKFESFFKNNLSSNHQLKYCKKASLKIRKIF